MRGSVFLVALFLLSTISFAALLNPDTLNMVMGFIIMAVTVLLGLAYMVSQTLHAPQLEAWTRNELRELLVAGVIFVLINTAFFGRDNVVGLLAGTSDPMGDARDFVDATHGQISNVFRSNMRLMHALTQYSGFAFSVTTAEFWWFYFSYNGAPYSGASILLGPLQSASQGITNAWFEYAGISLLMDYAETATAILLPIAFIFRFIPFTRSLGNSLLAIALGGRILLPFSILLVSGMHDLLGSSMPNPTIPSGVFDTLDVSDILIPLEAVCSIQPIRLLLNLKELLFTLITCLPLAWWPPAYAICSGAPPWGTQPGSWPGIMPIVYDVLMVIFRLGYGIYFASKGIISPGSPEGASAEELVGAVYPFMREVNNFVLVTYIDLLVIAIVTYIGTKSISSVLGGEYMMPLMSKLVK